MAKHVPNTTSTTIYLGYGAPYAPQPSLNNNQASWKAVQAALAASNGKGITCAELHALLVARNHGLFTKYVQARQWLAPMGATVTTGKGARYTVTATPPK